MTKPFIKANRGYHTASHTELIRGGRSYFDRMEQLILEATDTIHLQVYIFNNDSTGQRIATALKTAATSGVKVYLMADGYASQSLPASFIKELTDAGIAFRYFEPLMKSRHFYFGRRMHHKVLVVDAYRALTGGLNIADRYNDIDGIPAWLDFALYVEGEVAKELCNICRKEWMGYVGDKQVKPCSNKNEQGRKQNDYLVRIARNDWVRRKNQVSGMYINMLRSSRKEVIILCSYFLPGRLIRRQLVKAARRGVTVKVVTAGKSDIAIAKNAERWLYDYLLRNNVQLYEYNDNILHGKIAACDHEWMTAGSYNINNLSAYASIELNLAVQDPDFAAATQQQLQEIIDSACSRVTREQHGALKKWLIQFKRWCSYHLLRTLLYLFTFYYKQEKI